MSDILRAIAISAGILLPVVVLIIIVSMAAVRRGEASVRAAHGISEPELHGQVHGAAAPAAKKPEKATAAMAATDEISVPNILLFGFILFTLAVLALFAVSILGHL